MKIRSGFVSNSSSSSFICKTELSVKEAEEKLHQILAGFNIMMEENYKYDDLFDPVVEISEETTSGMVEVNYLEYYDYRKERFYESNIIIRSMTDNSIPYELHEVIENKFNAFRLHLG